MTVGLLLSAGTTTHWTVGWRVLRRQSLAECDRGVHTPWTMKANGTLAEPEGLPRYREAHRRIMLRRRRPEYLACDGLVPRIEYVFVRVRLFIAVPYQCESRHQPALHK